LKDVVKSKQCRYKIANPKSQCNGLEITFDVIERAILEKLKKIKIDEELYNKFMKFINSELEITKAKNKAERVNITLQISKINSEKTNFIKRNL
jgi:ssDNA-binding replication factor A large subunit